jgi:hypothetical protein
MLGLGSKISLIYAVCAAMVILGPNNAVAQPANPAKVARSDIPQHWLGERVTVAEAEAQHISPPDDRIARYPQLGLPFGFENPKWDALKREMRDGDELRLFESPPDSWRALAGRAGIALVRDGQVVAYIISIMN